ncbi:hypothetical protein [Candidatus Coxiella mudrowiae]|uniref:hypothetical protein n=1 Tax=Candidatus Coxiella mudrowiae TaxID=2054173 RepID=UPI001F199DF6|nr:hypothetical protein [Candidatus Coxiella mudrowiae]
MPTEQFITFPVLISKKELKSASGYQDITNNYPHVGALQILDFPYAVKLPHHRYRLLTTGFLTTIKRWLQCLCISEQSACSL